MFDGVPRKFLCRVCEGTFPVKHEVTECRCPYCCSLKTHQIGWLDKRQMGMKGVETTFVQDPTSTKSTIPSLGRKVGRGAKAQMKLYDKIIEQNRKRAKAKARYMGKRDDSDFRMLGQIPREMAVALQNQHGKNYLWENDPKEVLKREGLYYGDD